MHSRSRSHNIQFHKISHHYIKFIIFPSRATHLVSLEFTGVALHAADMRHRGDATKSNSATQHQIFILSLSQATLKTLTHEPDLERAE